MPVGLSLQVIGRQVGRVKSPNQKKITNGVRLDRNKYINNQILILILLCFSIEYDPFESLTLLILAFAYFFPSLWAKAGLSPAS